MRRFPVLVALVLFALAPASLSGQVEFGTDLALNVMVPDVSENVTAFSLPTSTLRVAFHTSESLAIEPRVSLNYVSSDGSSVSQLGLAAALLYSFNEGAYVFGQAGFDRVDFDGSDGTQAKFGGGIGFRKPIDDRLGLRWELGALIQPETDDFESATVFSASMGVSFFTDGD